ncbi:MAG TPA: YbaB/EbfC family nucleoid-associated protein [Anaerolineales bacterium]|nr:YbaB/EbfC family nucleoid-associated protein [Anaerolineales bacterium]
MAKKSKPRMPPGIGGGPTGMMQQLQQLQSQMLEAQNALADETVSGTAGGVVTVTVSGDQRCVGIEIAPEVLADGDVELLQELIVTAFNQALEASRQMAEERLGPLASGLGGLGLGF